MKKVIILGAGIYQVPLIKKAVEMGIYTILCSIPGDYPGFALADKVYYENTTDCEAILRIAQQEQIDGILTTGTDVAVRTIGYVCDRMNLCGVSEITAQKATDKAKMKAALTNSGVRTARFCQVQSLDEAAVACREIGFPVMVKCVDKSGSRGIEKVSAMDELENAVKNSFAYTDLPYLVVEKYISGYEIGFDGYVSDGQYCFWPHAKLVFHNGMTDVPLGHLFPFECSRSLHDDLLIQARKSAEAIGLTHGFFNMDIMIDGDASYVIEIGARTGATCIPELISLYCGFDIYEEMLHSAIGEEVHLWDKGSGACAARLLTAPRDGVIKSYNPQGLVQTSDCAVVLDYAQGQTVRQFHVGPDRIGHIIVKAAEPAAVFQKIDELEHDLQLVIE